MMTKKNLLEAIEDMPKMILGDRGLFMRYDTKGLWYCGYDNTTVFASDRELPIALEKLREISTPSEENWVEIEKKWEADDLDEEIKRFLESEESTTYENAGSYKVAVKDPVKIARHFAQWQKNQMMKDAEDGFIFQTADYYPKELIARYDGDLKMGDKVKIIIVKEEKK